jgi:hypothetical protein
MSSESNNQQASSESEAPTEAKPSEPIKRMELGGILVYDAYARITGA